jgi:SPP1 gp7 family putative phage head morphogenesis protein
VAPVSSVANPPDPAQLAVRNVRRKGQKAPEYGSDEHKAIWDAFIKRVDPHEARLGRAVRALLVEQEKEVLGHLGDGKAMKSAQNLADDPFDQVEWRKRFREKCDPIIKQTVQAAGDAAAADLDTFFSLEDPAVVEFLDQREQRFAQRVNETTWRELKDSLEEGIHMGESIPELEKRVTDTMTLRQNQSKEAIARTETIGASNGGTLESWKQSDMVAEKTWIATFDDRVRDTHYDAHGQTVGLDDDFTVGNGSGPAPGQIGLPEEDIQCRCTMASVLK